MSCEDCERFEKEHQQTGRTYYYRWKNANIGLIGCEKHIKEVIDWLNKKESV